MYKKERCGITPEGKELFKYTLFNSSGLSASFINLGGIWVSMMVPDREGHLEDVVLGYDTPEAWLNNSGHLGEIVGRSANRIGGAAFTLNGRRYQLAANDGPNNLHSGYDFYRNRIWDAEASESEEGTALSFTLKSPDGDQGYPGTALITVTYTLTENNAVKISYHMICDQDTVANMTNHSYFNLAGHRSEAAMSHQVWIDADYYTPMDEHSIPTGKLAPVKGTPMDFTVEKPIERDILEPDQQLKLGCGYDHNFVLNHKEKELALSARVCDENSGRHMEIYTDLPGMQFYTANYLNAEFPGKEGAFYHERQGYCFETQHFPNAVNTPDFPSPVLKAGDKYHTTTVYAFHTDKA